MRKMDERKRAFIDFFSDKPLGYKTDWAELQDVTGIDLASKDVGMPNREFVRKALDYLNLEYDMHYGEGMTIMTRCNHNRIARRRHKKVHRAARRGLKTMRRVRDGIPNLSKKERQILDDRAFIQYNTMIYTDPTQFDRRDHVNTR